MRATVESRFWSKVRKTDLCWVWLANTNHYGHGHFWDGTREVKAHRFAYELLVGPISEGLDLDHLCRNPGCVKPEHLEPVTRQENCRRGFTGIVTTLRSRAQTRCKHGHLYDGANTILTKKGHRRCRTCKRERDRLDYLKRTGHA